MHCSLKRMGCGPSSTTDHLIKKKKWRIRTWLLAASQFLAVRLLHVSLIDITCFVENCYIFSTRFTHARPAHAHIRMWNFALVTCRERCATAYQQSMQTDVFRLFFFVYEWIGDMLEIRHKWEVRLDKISSLILSLTCHFCVAQWPALHFGLHKKPPMITYRTKNYIALTSVSMHWIRICFFGALWTTVAGVLCWPPLDDFTSSDRFCGWWMAQAVLCSPNTSV